MHTHRVLPGFIFAAALAAIACGPADPFLQLNTTALGPYGEPANGVVFLTNDSIQTCVGDDWPSCLPVAGLAYRSPNAEIYQLGSAVVTNLNPHDWKTLAHEVGHTLGLWHDVAIDGFTNSDGQGLMPILGQAEDDPNVDNNERWESAFELKGAYPRSAGWYHTGCTGLDECAPLGKPGWSCNGAWCVMN